MQGAKIAPLHSSLGNKSETLSQKKKKKERKKRKINYTNDCYVLLSLLLLASCLHGFYLRTQSEIGLAVSQASTFS